MADASTALEPKELTVAASANRCVESFQQCLLRASSVHSRELSMVEDQVARFHSWATGGAVFASRQASMDQRLRYTPEVKSVVAGLLESLDYRIRTCTDALDAISKSDVPNPPTTLDNPLEQSFRDIASEISRLNKISNTIRRAIREDQFLKANNFQIYDDEGNDVEPLLLSYCERILLDRFPYISSVLQQRLARATLLRRRRILYRRHRRSNKATALNNKATVASPSPSPAVVTSTALQARLSARDRPKTGIATTTAASVITTTASQVSMATTLDPENFKKLGSAMSVVSASKIVALGYHENLNFPPPPGFAAKRKYERLRLERLAAHRSVIGEEGITSAEARLEQSLKTDLQAIGEIDCPYCLYALPAEEVFDVMKWQKHVLGDLDPYVCLVEDCDRPDELYNHSGGWLNHLHQHGRRWRCASHPEPVIFSTSEEYIQHMREAHNPRLRDTQLRVLANRNARRTAKLFQICPLCGIEETTPSVRMEDHIAGHLRALALNFLPSYEDEISDDTRSVVESEDSSRPQSRGTVRDFMDYEDALDIYHWDEWESHSAEDDSTNFLGNGYREPDSSAEDAWMGIWDWKSFGGPDDDAVLQSLLKQRDRFGYYEASDGSNNVSNID